MGPLFLSNDKSKRYVLVDNLDLILDQLRPSVIPFENVVEIEIERHNYNVKISYIKRSVYI